MSDNLVLQSKRRDLKGKKAAELRKKGILPAVIYGHGISPQSLAVEEIPFIKIYKQAGESTLVDLVIGDQKPVKVIIQDIQRHPVTHQIIHIDFHQVKMTEKITAETDLVFTGESPAVKEEGGVLVKNLDALKVSCLPQDLIKEVDVDISPLKTFADIIHVSDIKVPQTIEVLNKPDEVVVLVTPPRSEEELADLEKGIEEEKAVEEVKVAGKEELSAAETMEGEEGPEQKAKKEKPDESKK